MQRKIIIQIACLLLAFIKVSAQENDQKSFVHLDKPFYVSGEIIQYKLYLPAYLKDQNFVVRSSLINRDKQIVDYHFLRNESSKALSGYYKVPFDIPADWYQLSFHLYDLMGQQEISLIDAAIPIYSDLSSNQNQVSSTQASQNEKVSNKATIFNIQTSQDAYSPRDEITVNISLNTPSTPTAVSISVYDQELINNHGLGVENVHVGSSIPPNINATNQLYELGYLMNEAGEPIKANVLGAYASDQNIFNYCKTNEEGLFYLELEDFYAQQAIQFLDYQREDISIDLLERPWKLGSTPLPYTEEILEYLDLSRSRKKIYQLYADLEQKLEIATSNIEPQEMVADKSYPLADYDPFPTVGDFFRELKTPLQYRIIKGKMRARMFNPTTQWHNKGRVLFNIGGQLTRNDEYVAQLPLDQFQQIDLIFDSKQLKDKYRAIGVDGTVILTPSEQLPELPDNEKVDIFEMHGLLSPRVDVEDLANFPAAQPLLRPHLYWNPNFEMDNQGKGKINFQQSDDLGTFRIQVVAQLPDGKEIIQYLDYYCRPMTKNKAN